MTQTGGKKKVKRRTTKRKPAKRKAPVRRKTTKRKAPVRKTKRRAASKSRRKPARKTTKRKTVKRKTVKRRSQRGGTTVNLHQMPMGPGGPMGRLQKMPHPGHGPTALRNMQVRRAGPHDIMSRQLVGTNTSKADNKRFIRPPTMDMPPHVQMDPMNEINAYLSDYYMNVDVEQLARQMYGEAVHAVHNTSPSAGQYYVGGPRN